MTQSAKLDNVNTRRDQFKCNLVDSRGVNGVIPQYLYKFMTVSTISMFSISKYNIPLNILQFGLFLAYTWHTHMSISQFGLITTLYRPIQSGPQRVDLYILQLCAFKQTGPVQAGAKVSIYYTYVFSQVNVLSTPLWYFS